LAVDASTSNAAVQTGNVIFFAINLFQRHWATSFSRLWPIFAFVAGVAMAAHITWRRMAFSRFRG
jgi:uncharacterized membrane protein YoaK (UPF0700 family)